jgi:uncharacterized membrane protein
MTSTMELSRKIIPPPKLRRELQKGNSRELQYRRVVIGLSLVGIASMAAVTLLQTGIVKHLADPPVGNFNSDKVNSSDTAYRFGLPDGSVSLATLAANVPLAAFGGEDRARKYPWVPIVAAIKAGAEAVAAAWYFYQMPAKEKAWCPYCITGALANIGIFGFTIPEALKGFRFLRR